MLKAHTLMRALFLFCGALFAQDFRGSISGQVTDSTGATVANATIKAINLSNNQVFETKANGNGLYTLTYLNPATYNVEVSAQGFAMLRRENIILQVADKLNL